MLNSYFNGKKGDLIYLTKYGSEAEKYSLGTLKTNEYHRISYRKHILEWLIACIASCEEVSPPLWTLRYALKQYQSLVEKITGKSMNHELNNQLAEILLKDNNFESAQKIASVISLAKGKILFNFFKELETEITKTPNVSVKENYCPSLEYNENQNEEKCHKWFMGGKENRHVGVFFDIGIPSILFRVEVATYKLHYGIVPVNQNDFDNLKIPPSFTRKDWRIIWFSKIYKDVFNDVNLIRNENTQHLINEIKNSIDGLIKLHE